MGLPSFLQLAVMQNSTQAPLKHYFPHVKETTGSIIKKKTHPVGISHITAQYFNLKELNHIFKMS